MEGGPSVLGGGGHKPGGVEGEGQAEEPGEDSGWGSQGRRRELARA